MLEELKNAIVMQSTAIKKLVEQSEKSEFSLVGDLSSSFYISVDIDGVNYVVSNINQDKPKTYKEIKRAVAYIVDEFCVNTITLKIRSK